MRFVDEFKNKNIMVIGDVMLDEYYKGSVGRISPEAPVPVFLKKNTSYHLGGAANVAINLAANDQNVSVLAIIGKDKNGDIIRELFKSNGISEDCLVETERPTTTKCRLLASANQQVLRIDIEDSGEIDSYLQTRLLEKLSEKISGQDIIILSDYMKGLLTFDFTRKVIEMANEHGVRVLVDVKDTRSEKYRNSFIVKPNKKELSAIIGSKIENEEDVIRYSIELCKKCESSYVLTTCGADGMVLVNSEGLVKKLNTTSQEVFDVTGAGDTVIAYIGLCLANGMDVERATTISNYAAGIQVSKVGTSTVGIDEVARVIKDKHSEQVNSYKKIERSKLTEIREKNIDKKIVFTNGCFDILHIGHVRYLKKAAALGDILIVGLNSDDSVRRIKGPDRPVNNQDDRLEVLAALDFVDYVVIFNEDTPYEIIKLCQPDFLVKGGDYKPEEVVGRDIVEGRGGRLVLIPFVKGRSTTNIIEKIKHE